MKLFLGLLCAALAFTVANAGLVEEPVGYYHEAVGIAAAERIRRAEAKAESEVVNEAEVESGSRISGGLSPLLGTHPYMGGLVVTLTTGNTSVCGSSLVSSTRLVTAAHCWWDGRFQARQFLVVLGSLKLFSGGERILTDDVVAHGSWNPTTLANDIALIRIKPVQFTRAIAPVSLPNTGNVEALFVGWWADAVGYGMTGDGLNAIISPDQSQSAVSMRVITNAICQRTHTRVVASMICASGELVPRGVCTGDSGGPLVFTDTSMPMLIGIASFGWAQGCTSGLPVAFTRITSFNTWIRVRL